jgi:hypothetical protein
MTLIFSQKNNNMTLINSCLSWGVGENLSWFYYYVQIFSRDGEFAGLQTAKSVYKTSHEASHIVQNCLLQCC